MNTSLASKNDLLRDRAAMFAQARTFFAQRNILEVDCPALSLSACVDTHIDPMRVEIGEHLTGYLHTSPEYGMKRLLAEGLGDIYQISHVFRKEEIGPRHQPEFTMVEWYRLGFSFEQMIDETLAFTRLFLGEKPDKTLTYRQAFIDYVGIDYTKADRDELLRTAKQHQLALSPEAESSDKDALLQCLMSFVIEPNLPREQLVVIRDYPSTQAALAQTDRRKDEEIAERFEIYFNGVELANGYHELVDAKEQRERFARDNTERQQLGKEPLPVDEQFLKALESGLPNCCGVAVGFDRLMLLRHGEERLERVVPLPVY